MGYLTDAIYAAAASRQRDDSYKIYTTDLLRCIAQAMGCTVERRYYDILHPAPVDDRDAEEIGSDFMRRHGLRSAGDGPQSKTIT